jgi:hypothetical protein
MKNILFLASAVLLSACATKKPVVVQMPRSIPGTVISATNIESVRYGENIKAYPIGRYVEPNNRLVMHEAHTVYRVETTAKWNLHPNAPVPVPTGPIVQIIDPARRESPLTPEVAAEVNKQKDATKAVIEQSNRMNQTLVQLSQSVSSARQVAEENVQLKQEVNSTKQRLEALEEQFRKRQTETFTSPSILTKGTNDW